MYLSKKYKLKEWYSFDDEIFEAARKFYKSKKMFANMIIFNNHTYEQICFLIAVSPKREFISDDDGEPEISLAKFQYLDCSLQCATTSELKDKEFELVYNSDEDSDDDDSDDEIIPPFRPIHYKNILVSL